MGVEVAVSLVLKDTLTLEGLKRILGDQGFGMGQCVSDLSDLSSEMLVPGQIIVIDASLIPADDLSKLEALIAAQADLRVILLDAACNVQLVVRSLAIGTKGYILRNVPSEVFVTMVTLVALGEKVVPTEMISALPSANFDHANAHDGIGDLYDLGEREKEILACLVMGLPNKVISRELDISEATVKAAVKGIFRKMSVTNRTQAAILARQSNESRVDGTFGHR